MSNPQGMVEKFISDVRKMANAVNCEDKFSTTHSMTLTIIKGLPGVSAILFYAGSRIEAYDDEKKPIFQIDLSIMPEQCLESALNLVQHRVSAAYTPSLGADALRQQERISHQMQPAASLSNT